MESSKQVERLQIREDDDIEVSCTLLALEHNKSSIDELIQKIATSINVQLALEQENQEIPFVHFSGFDNVQHDDKLFLCGPSGCGKSRGIFEITKRTITEEKEKGKRIKNIYIINPRRALENESIDRVKLYELVNKFNDNDIVIWDNFPDGSRVRLSGKHVKNMEQKVLQKKKGLLIYGPLSLLYFAALGYFAKRDPVAAKEFRQDFSRVEDSIYDQQVTYTYARIVHDKDDYCPLSESELHSILEARRTDG
jgi:hypothetical protein